MEVMGLIYLAVAIYFAFHVASRSDIAALPRKWVKEMLGPTLSYPLDCVFCMSFWTCVAIWLLLTPTFPLPLVAITFIPTFNMVLDLLIEKLRKDAEKSSVTINVTDRLSPTVYTETNASSGWKS